MKGKVKTWADRMNAWNVPSALRIVSYKMNLWPALKYPLGVCQLSEKEVEELERPLRPLLKYANYVSEKFSNEILNLPLKYGGYGVYQIHKVMVCEQVKMLPTTLRVDDNTGCKIRSLL